MSHDPQPGPSPAANTPAAPQRTDSRSWTDTLTAFPDSFRPPTVPHPARYQEVERVRIHRRHTLFAVLWSAILAGPFLGAVQGGAVPLLAEITKLSDRWYGLLQSLPALALLAQFPAVFLVDRLPHRPRAVLWFSIVGRLIWIPIAAIPLLFSPGTTATTLFLTGCAISWIGWQLGALAWQSFVGDLVPARRRGRYFGVRTRLFAASSLISSLALALTLPTVDQPHAPWIIFGIFTLASLFGAVELIVYHSAYDPPRKRQPIKVKDLVTPLTDRSFLPFLLFGSLLAASNGILGPFLWRHLLVAERIDPFHTTLILQTSALIGVFLMAPLWGLWVDRHGTKAATIIAMITGLLFTLAWPLVTADRWMLGLIVGFGGVALWTGVDVAVGNRLFAHGSKGGPGYFAVFNAALAFAGFGATAFGGELAERLGQADWLNQASQWARARGFAFNNYMVLLILCLLLRLAALAVQMKLLPRDRPTPTAQGVRAIALQMQSHLSGLFALPWRSLRSLPGLRETPRDHDETPKS